MAVLLVSFLVLMVLGCPIAFCLLCSGTFYFLANDMALIMVVQRLTEGEIHLHFLQYRDLFLQET